jgi:ComF family protein
MKIFKFIKDIIAPKKCYSCFKEWLFLCEECYNKLYNFDEICYICKSHSENYIIHEKCKKSIYFDNILVLSHYKNNVIKKLVKDSKFHHKKDILEDFSIYLWELLTKYISNEYWIINIEDFVIIPTPMYFLKKFTRWYNQAEILAQNISKNTGINYYKNIIKKSKNTKQQSSLTKEKRLKNLETVFKINNKYLYRVNKKIIIIVDDVISTWTTINEISKILKNNWAQKIIWLCIASD